MGEGRESGKLGQGKGKVGSSSMEGKVGISGKGSGKWEVRPREVESGKFGQGKGELEVSVRKEKVGS